MAASESGNQADQIASPEAAAEEGGGAGACGEGGLRPALPVGRVKRIIRVDREIKKVTAEAALLVAAAAELFVGSLAGGARAAAMQRGRRAVRAAHLRAAAIAHRPTADFLLDCLPADDNGRPPPPRPAARAAGGEAKPLPRGTRRIDTFFQKPAAAAAAETG